MTKFLARWILLLTIGPAALGQVGAGTTASAPQKLVAFDVASIKLNNNDTRHFAKVFPRDGDGFLVEYMPLEFLLRLACGIRQADVVMSGLPDWARTDHYDITAKVADADVAEWKTYSDEMKWKVVKQLLTESFKLQIHTETHEGPTFDLVIAPGGLKMKAVAPPANNPDGFIELYRPGVIKGHQVKMGPLVQYLSQLKLGRAIQDKTGLTGTTTSRWAALRWRLQRPATLQVRRYRQAGPIRLSSPACKSSLG